MSKIILVRHGQSLTNVDLDIEAQQRGEPIELNVRNNVLTQFGVTQALAFGTSLTFSDVKIKTIVCSPYARTKQTAYCISSALGTAPMIHYDRALREIDWKIGGRWHRMEDSIPDFDTKTAAIDYKPLIIRRKNLFSLESQLEVYERVTKRFVELVARYAPAGDLLIVSHYFPIKAILAYVLYGDAEKMRDYDPRNVEPHVLELEEVQDRINSLA